MSVMVIIDILSVTSIISFIVMASNSTPIKNNTILNSMYNL
jgi:hypothetical protein